MIERLPTPWGLVRLGVAPDHPQLKTVSRAFEKIAARPGFRFLGNVEVGRDVDHDELAGALRRVRLCGRLAVGQAARHPRRGPPGLVGRDRARRLVQRPPRLPAARVRPLARARGRDRERERRARRRAHARADRRRARADRHDGRGHRRDRRRRESARSSSSGGAGPVQAAWTSDRARRAGRSRRRGRRSSTRPSSSSIAASEAELEARLERRAAQHRDPPRDSRAREPAASRSRPAPVPCLAGRDPRRRARRGGRGRRATGSSPTGAEAFGPSRPTSAR